MALTLVLTGGSASADGNGNGNGNGNGQPPPCDKVTGGGYIFPPDQITGAPQTEEKGTFSIAGGCKHGSPPYWGHMNYHDHGTGLHAHWTVITHYFFDGPTTTDPETKQRLGVRFTCGEATTNLPTGDAFFVTRVRDAGEGNAGVNLDEFDIQLKDRLPGGGIGPVVYTTAPGSPHLLGGGGPGGGNINLHKDNPSTTGDFTSPTCPAL